MAGDVSFQCAVGQNENSSSPSDAESDDSTRMSSTTNALPANCLKSPEISFRPLDSAQSAYCVQLANARACSKKVCSLMKQPDCCLNFCQSNRHSRKPNRNKPGVAEETVCENSFSKNTMEIASVDPDDGSVSVLHAVASSSSTNCDEMAGHDVSRSIAEESSLDSSVTRLVAFGGINLSAVDDGPPGRLVSRYNADENSWGSLSVKISHFLHHHGVLVVHGKFYIIGMMRTLL